MTRDHGLNEEAPDPDRSQAGRDLDARVARTVMGWTAVSNGPFGVVGVPPQTLRPKQEPVPRFSNDIAAAWLVVERMRDRGYQVAVWVRIREYVCAISAEAEADIAHADSAPLAICRAALKAVQRPA